MKFWKNACTCLESVNGSQAVWPSLFSFAAFDFAMCLFFICAYAGAFIYGTIYELKQCVYD